MKKTIEKIEQFMELGGMKKDIVLLIVSGAALIVSIFNLLPLPFDAAWIALIFAAFQSFWRRSLAWLLPLILRQMFLSPLH